MIGEGEIKGEEADSVHIMERCVGSAYQSQEQMNSISIISEEGLEERWRPKCTMAPAYGIHGPKSGEGIHTGQSACSLPWSYLYKAMTSRTSCSEEICSQL